MLRDAADSRYMPLTRLRFAVVAAVLVACSVGATVTLAAARQAAAHRSSSVPAVKWPPLVVPDVRGQIYVFAKGMLEDAGFGFRVQGSVPGFPGNHVVVQVPAPGTKVLNNGSPVVTLRLSGSSKAQGSPQNLAPYPMSQLRVFHRRVTVASRVVPKAAAPTAKAAPKAKPAATPAHVKHATKTAAQRRQPDFVVAGAPKEPLDEMPLVDRARKLDSWVASHPAQTPANVQRWLFQHAWIVTGAKFGWWHGAQALQVLIGTDSRIEAQWGIGLRSQRQAQAALAWVQARKSTK
jgi:hypothetical protein